MVRRPVHLVRPLIPLLIGLLLLAGGCRRSPAPAAWTPLDPGAVDGANALAEARALVALGPRAAGTPGARAAANHLRARLAALGVAAKLEAFVEEAPGGPLTFWNVMATLPAAGAGAAEAPWMFLGSHFDTKAGIGPGFEGANDSASSTGLLLELARVLKAAGPLPVNLGLMFFDGEECRVAYAAYDGLHGSRHAARALRRARPPLRVGAVLILDMIGDRDLSVTLPRNASPELLSRVFAAAAAEGARDRFSLMPGGLLDDHVPFLEAGFPALTIIDFHYGSAPGLNDYWHTSKDTLDRLSADSLGLVGRVALRVLNDLVACSHGNPRRP